MHPALDLNSLAALPSLVKGIAQRAGNGSLDDVMFLEVSRKDMPVDLLIGLLPVYYVNLNPAAMSWVAAWRPLRRKAGWIPRVSTGYSGC
ncbi:hypothetical protein B0H17DRAFT_1200429 [Mycena rosella]|uniref:Uncharacterized protein n=1 Tax=Mycena rosella TaxID=1033263 RepID=A0AAD7DJ82_MYCRO|nr:hypothetical protein B0H17DRAFT_1200429 [Mycena rosella]